MNAKDTFLVVLDRELRIETCNKAFADAVGFDATRSDKPPVRTYVSQRDRIDWKPGFCKAAQETCTKT